jgi:hypothetical protein
MRPRRLPLLLVAIVLAVTACADRGDGDDQVGPTSTTAGGPTSGPTGTSTTVTAAEPAGSPLVLRGDGLGVVDLGAPPDTAVAAVAAELGDPSVDTGWEPSFSTYGTCPGSEIRGVEWDGLVLLFTDGATAFGDGPHLFAWRVVGAPPAVGTATGLGFGASADDAEELHPGAVEVVPPEEPFPGFLEIDADGGPITAFLDGEVITNLEAGTPCGE